MPFGFGAKKDEKKKPAPAAPQPSTNYAAPPIAKADPAPANGGADDMFGGMTQPVARRRGKTGKGKKGGADDAAAIDDTTSVISDAKSSENTTAKQDEAPSPDGAESNADSAGTKPFTAPKFSFGGDDAEAKAASPDAPTSPGGFDQFQVEDEETARLRARLERFYGKYNPQKLSKLDQTIEAYKGKEEKLFKSLVVKYGPEPGDEAPAAAESGDAGGGGGWGSTSNTSGGKETGGWGDTSGGDAGGGGGWGSTEDTTAATGFGDAPSGGGGFGFGGSDEKATGGSGGFGDDSGGGFGDDSGGGGFGDAPSGGGGGFGFDDTNADDKKETGGFGFGDDTSGGGGGFGFGATEETPAATEDATEEKPAPAAPAPPTESDTESEEEDVPLWEQHRREISSAASYLIEKQGDVARVVSSLAKSISIRHSQQKLANQCEAAMDTAVANDDFEEAGRKDDELQGMKKDIAACDATCDALPTSISEEEEGLEGAFLDLASLAEQQGQSLKNNLADEERKVDKYITETTHKVGQTSDRVAADLEKATRSMNNVEQEVVNLEQRRAKVVEKNETATSGHRKNRDELATSKKEVEEEIRQLEQTLAQKRRLLAERKMELGDVEEKLGVIMADHEENLKDVDEQMAEERKKLEKTQATVAALAAQEDKVNRERADLSNEAERLNTQLANQREKMITSADVAESIRQSGLVSLKEYYSTTLAEVLALRQQGKGFLCATPSSFPELAKITNALSQLDIEAQQETSLQSTNTLRLQEISKSLPVVEAAKKAAALAKQFKEASAKTTEIKNLNEEKVTVEQELAASMEKSSALNQQQADLRAKKRVEEKAIAKKMEGFVLGYFEKLQAAIRAAPAGTGVQHWIDTISGEGAPESSDAVLTEAVVELLNVLDTECRATPVKLDGPASGPTSPVKQTPNPSFPTNGGAEKDEVEEEEEEVKEAEPEAPTKTKADIQAEITKLEADIESAMEMEDYDQCELCQNLIDQLKVQLEGME